MARTSTKAASAPRDLAKEMAAAAALKEQLKHILGEGQYETDVVTLQDTIEGETELFETIDAVLEQLGQDIASQEALAKYETSIAARKERLKKREQAMRTMLANALDILEQKRFERPLATITRKDVAPKLVVADEAAIPSAWWKTPEPVLDRKALTDELKARGEALDALEAEYRQRDVDTEYKEKLAAVLAAHPPIPGAELGNGGSTVQVRFS